MRFAGGVRRVVVDHDGRADQHEHQSHAGLESATQTAQQHGRAHPAQEDARPGWRSAGRRGSSAPAPTTQTDAGATNGKRLPRQQRPGSRRLTASDLEPQLQHRPAGPRRSRSTVPTALASGGARRSGRRGPRPRRTARLGPSGQRTAGGRRARRTKVGAGRQRRSRSSCFLAANSASVSTPRSRRADSFSIATNGSTGSAAVGAGARLVRCRLAGLPDRVGERLHVALDDPRDRHRLLAHRERHLAGRQARRGRHRVDRAERQVERRLRHPAVEEDAAARRSARALRPPRS